ncbi:squalene synthase HpnC [Acidocella sp.]|uniref:squalene synthase HpnC n=1 Tax=Acidocella sp. TaxID=50710 RepID=UPI002F3E8E81
MPPASAPNVESWSGKDRGDENFPVGSWLIRKELRDHVHAYYTFARNADDISDSFQLPPDQKIARLNAMEEVLMGVRTDGSPSAEKLRESLGQSGVTELHARELLVAFRQDAVKNRYANWGELMEYCRYSAAPVGRYVLDLHGEDRATWGPSDALCASLQVLNHLQDCAKDLRDLDRCYIPQDWLREAGLSTDDVARPETMPGLRAVFDRMLAATDELNRAAAELPRRVKARRLRVETAIICSLARRLTEHLKGGDPLAMRVKLSKADFLAATLAGLRFAA